MLISSKRLVLKTITGISLGTLIGLMGGCATAPGSQFKDFTAPKSGQSQLYIYRASSIFASGMSMPVFVDNNKVSDLYNGSFLKLETTPGKHHVKIDTTAMGKSAEADIDVTENKNFFYQLEYCDELKSWATVQPHCKQKMSTSGSITPSSR